MVRKVSRAGVISRSTRLKGGSIKRVDQRKSAMFPGKRQTSKPHEHHGRKINTSTKYYENRRNRADISTGGRMLRYKKGKPGL